MHRSCLMQETSFMLSQCFNFVVKAGHFFCSQFQAMSNTGLLYGS